MLAKLLLVEDIPLSRRLLAEWFKRYPDFTTAEAESLHTATELLKADVFDCIILDLHLKDSPDPVGTFTAVQALTMAPIVVYTGDEDADLRQALIEKGACGFIAKAQNTEIDVENAVVRCIAAKRGGSPKLEPRDAHAKAVVWSSGIGGALAFFALLALDVAKEWPHWTPKDWQIGVVYAALFGSGAYQAAHKRNGK